MTYDQAIRQYGTDKPDMRLPYMTDIRPAFSDEDLADLRIDGSMNMVAIRIPDVGKISDREKKELRVLAEDIAKRNKEFVGVFYDFAQLEKKRPQAVAKIRELCCAGVEDLIVPVVTIASGEKVRTSANQRAQYTSAGEARLELGRKYADRHRAFERTDDVAHDFKFLWVTDFPMFEFDDKENRWNAAHHPFTSPHEQDMGKLQSDPGAVCALAYDVVLNGTELGSGSIRIHRQDIQKQIFTALGMSDEEARSRFGFFLDALEYGTPPHGGIALGLDRIVMILASADSLREVIPFPKTARAVDMMVDAPSAVETPQEDQLELMAAWPHLSTEDWSIAKLCDDLFSAIDYELGRLSKLQKANPWELAFLCILSKGYNDGRAAVRLAKSGYGPQAAALSRAVLEGAINARFVEFDTQKNGPKLLATIKQETFQLASDLLTRNPSFASIGVIHDAIERPPDSSWPSLAERLDEVGEHRARFEAAWTALSDFAEYRIGSLASIARVEDNRISIRLGRGGEVVNLALTATFDFLWDSADAALRSFGASPKALGTLRERFTRQLMQNSKSPSP
jgi:hypothetical protein